LGPLNYALLDSDKLFTDEYKVLQRQERKMKIRKAIRTDIKRPELDDPDFDENRSSYVGLIVDSCLKNAGAKKKHELRKAQDDEKQELSKRIAGLKVISLGSLAANNCYCITMDEVLHHAENKEETEKKELCDKKRKKKSDKQKANRAFKASYDKYRAGAKLIKQAYAILLWRITRDQKGKKEKIGPSVQYTVSRTW
jgi:hypothetical protein